MRLAGIASLVVAASMIVAKLVSWMMTDSVGMLASLADSLLDLVASAVTFWAIRAAAPDEEHRFGHGKAEPIAALAQAGFVIGTSVLVAVQAMHQLINPMPLSHVGVGMAVMAAACVLTTGLVLWQRWVYQQTHSVAVKADSLHYQADLGINLVVLLAFWITDLVGWWWLDGVIGLGHCPGAAAQRLAHWPQRDGHADGSRTAR
jgi:ferrous-iron efflux pump FieF